MQKSYRALRAIVVAAHVLSPFAAVPPAVALTGGVKLPAPAVSRALDAVLMPINKAVAREFKLGSKEQGLLVIAVQPGGVAAKQGIKAGDVLAEVGGRRVRKPVDVDVAVRRGLKNGNTNYSFGLDRGGTAVAVAAVITLALYEEAFSVSEISSWESWTQSTSFSYSEFVSEYSSTIETSYESEESVVTEALTQEESTSEATAVEATDDTDGDGTSDASDDDDDNDGTPDGADTDDDNDGTADADETVDDGDADDEGTPDDAGTDDSAEDDAGEDDAGGDEGDDDDAGGDDSGGDDAGGDDSGGGEEE